MNSGVDKLLNIEEVAKMLRVSTRTIIRYIESGKLKASKIGVWRIKESTDSPIPMIEDGGNLFD